MPRLKKSQGRFKITTPVVDEIQRYVFYELVNAMQWNKKLIIQTQSANRWRFVAPNWIISYDGKAIIVESKESRVMIRKGLTLNMGSARLEIDGQVLPTDAGSPEES